MKYGNTGPSNSGGSGCYSMPQKGIPGPKSPGDLGTPGSTDGCGGAGTVGSGTWIW